MRDKSTNTTSTHGHRERCQPHQCHMVVLLLVAAGQKSMRLINLPFCHFRKSRVLAREWTFFHSLPWPLAIGCLASSAGHLAVGCLASSAGHLAIGCLARSAGHLAVGCLASSAGHLAIGCLARSAGHLAIGCLASSAGHLAGENVRGMFGMASC